MLSVWFINRRGKEKLIKLRDKPLFLSSSSKEERVRLLKIKGIENEILAVPY